MRLIHVECQVFVTRIRGRSLKWFFKEAHEPQDEYSCLAFQQSNKFSNTVKIVNIDFIVKVCYCI